MYRRHALRLICAQTRPAGAHLYLFGASGLYFATSVGELPVPEGLLDFLTSRFARGQGEMLTMTIALATSAVLPTAVSAFTDP
ncbi:MAG TPA: hypothetical protein VHU80_06180 [Polyangiaceae bacterium]|nr:hypothetical protein [Polyangiaceae bacterium]